MWGKDLRSETMWETVKSSAVLKVFPVKSCEDPNHKGAFPSSSLPGYSLCPRVEQSDILCPVVGEGTEIQKG